MSIDEGKPFRCISCDITMRMALREVPYFCPGCHTQGSVYPEEALHIAPTGSYESDVDDDNDFLDEESDEPSVDAAEVVKELKEYH